VKKRNAILYTILILLILGLVVVNMNTGSTELSFRQILRILSSHDVSGVDGIILWNIRLPRILAAILLGGSLALAGYLLQAFFSNPIAGPFVLGISSGAKLMVALLLVLSYRMNFHVSSLFMVGVSFAGAAVASLFVIFAARKVKSRSILIVCGVMIGYITSAITELVIAFAEDSNIVNLHNWSMGSFSSSSWSEVRSLLPILAVGITAAVLLSKGIEAYMYGENYAQSIGVNVKRFRVLLIAVSGLLSATVTAFAGPISFVGIAVPHLVRRLFRTSKPITIITGSFLAGAVFCLFCDLLARSLFAPMELSISTVTAVFGAPVVIAMLLKNKRG